MKQILNLKTIFFVVLLCLFFVNGGYSQWNEPGDEEEEEECFSCECDPLFCFGGQDPNSDPHGSGKPQSSSGNNPFHGSNGSSSSSGGTSNGDDSSNNEKPWWEKKGFLFNPFPDKNGNHNGGTLEGITLTNGGYDPDKEESTCVGCECDSSCNKTNNENPQGGLNPCENGGCGTNEVDTSTSNTTENNGCTKPPTCNPETQTVDLSTCSCKNKPKTKYYEDNDFDGVGGAYIGEFTIGQTPPEGSVTKGGDCNDGNINVHKHNKCGKCEEESKCKTPCDVTSKFGSNANSSKVNKCSLQKMKDIAAKLGIDEFEISSTARDAKNQARVMHNNIVSKGVASQKKLYGSNGDKVIDAYSTAKAKSGSTATSIKQAMEDKINELGPGNVSKHSADSNVLTVVDIKPSSISSNKRADFVKAIEQAIKNGDVSRFLHPGNSTDPAYHIEIKVKPCELKDCSK